MTEHQNKLVTEYENLAVPEVQVKKADEDDLLTVSDNDKNISTENKEHTHMEVDYSGAVPEVHFVAD